MATVQRMLEFLYSGDYSMSPRIGFSLENHRKALESSLQCKFIVYNTDYGWESYY